MSKIGAWLAMAAVAAATIMGLFVVASMRFPIALVYPAPPIPDYGLQATIAYSGCLLTIVALVVACLVVRRNAERRGPIVMRSSAAIIGVGLLAAAAALVVP